MDSNTELKQQLEFWTKEINERIARLELKKGNIEPLQLSKTLMELPPIKWAAAKIVIDSTIDKKTAMRNVKVIRAEKMLYASKMKGQRGLSNAEDRRAFVDNNEDVQAAEMSLIESEALLKAAELYYDCIEDLINACKKVFEFVVEQDRAQRDFDRYNNEASRLK